jgi:hypothetical protein
MNAGHDGIAEFCARSLRSQHFLPNEDQEDHREA